MTELSLDTKNKAIALRVKLAGEAEPIEIQISKYSLTHKGGTAQITIEEASASREWLHIALREFVVGQSFPIPEKATVLLKLLA